LAQLLADEDDLTLISPAARVTSAGFLRDAAVHAPAAAVLRPSIGDGDVERHCRAIARM